MAKGIALFASRAAQRAVARSVFRSEQEEKAKLDLEGRNPKPCPECSGEMDYRNRCLYCDHGH